MPDTGVLAHIREISWKQSALSSKRLPRLLAAAAGIMDIKRRGSL